jgi:hypothetical protein
MCAVTQTAGKNTRPYANLWQPGRHSEQTLQIIFPPPLFVCFLPHFLFYHSRFRLNFLCFPLLLQRLPCFCHGANFFQLSTSASFIREVSVQIPGRCCRYVNWEFSLFYPVPRGELEGRISKYTMTAFFRFRCNSLLANFRPFANIRSYILTNRNVYREVKNRKLNKFLFILFSSIFFFVRDWKGERHAYVVDHACPPAHPLHRDRTALRNSWNSVKELFLQRFRLRGIFAKTDRARVVFYWHA